MARCQKMCVCSDDHSRAHQRSAAINKAVDCGSKMSPHLPFCTDLAPSGSNLLPNMRKTLESYVCSDDHSRAHQRSAAINKAVDCGSKMSPHLPFCTDLAPSGSNLLPNMRKTLESYVFADYEEMIASVMGMQDMLEIFFFKECMRAWVKSCDKFGNMNDDYIDKQTFFVFKSSSYLCSFMVGPRTFWTPLVQSSQLIFTLFYIVN